MTQEAWFATLGEPLDASERADLQGYTQALGFAADMPVHAITAWDEADHIIRNPSLLWWEREEALRAALERHVHLSPADPAWIALNDTLHGAAASAAARFGCANSGLIKAATGAASYAAYHYRLAIGAQQPPTHAFIRKYALFAGGRWLLGVYDDRIAIF